MQERFVVAAGISVSVEFLFGVCAVKRVLFLIYRPAGVVIPALLGFRAIDGHGYEDDVNRASEA